MTKKYKLLKDMPGIKSGSDVRWSKLTGGYKYYAPDHFKVPYNFEDDMRDTIKKELVENNPSWFKEIKEDKPQWEILSYLYDGRLFIKTAWNSYICFDDDKFGHGKITDDYFLNKSGAKIHSVKRLSDGEVFTIGDFFTIKGNVTKYAIAEFCFDYTCEHLYVSNAGLLKCRLTKIQKAKEPERISDILQRENYFKDLQTWGKETTKWIESFVKQMPSSEPLYTQQEMDEARRDAFEAGGSKGFVGLIRYNRGVSDIWSYPTFQDYLSSLKK